MENTLKGLFGSRTRRTIVGILVIIVALSVIAYAYWRSLPSQTGPKVTLTSPPFELSLALDKTAYSLGDNMTMTFYLRNISNETTTITEPDIMGVDPNDPAVTLATMSEGVNTSYNIPGDNPLGVEFPFSFTLFSSNGTVVDKFPSGGGITTLISIFFQPGASLNQTLQKNSERNLAPIGHPLQKGAYQISATFSAYMGNIDHLTQTFALETPSITFTLGQ
jgi:hypothetical protein